MAGGVEEHPTRARAREGWFPLVGVIASAGFTSGHRFVCGVWEESPLGPVADLMWADAGGARRLVAPDDRVAAFVSAVYRFDELVVSPLAAIVEGRALRVDAPGLGLSIRARAGRGWPIPLPGPAWFHRRVAGPIARRALGVETYGVSPTGVREWYRARWYRPIVEATATLGGDDLGELGTLYPPVGFGFSEPPRRPSMVWVRPLLHDPSGGVARAVAG